MARK
jgi:hypothetical protein